jgi:hypothetical protein
MSTHVVAIRPPDDKWRQMKAVWDSCTAAGVDPPEEVADFFNDESPDDAGVIIDLPSYGTKHPAVKEYNDEGQCGLEIEISKLPPNVTHVRFINSW